MKTCSRVLRTSDWSEGSPSNDNDTKHTAKTTQEWFRANMNILDLILSLHILNNIYMCEICFDLEWTIFMHLYQNKAKTTQEWLEDKSLNVLEWPRQSQELNLIEHLWRDLKIAVQQCSPSNLTELERICGK